MKVAYRAFDKVGHPVGATIDAPGLAEASEALRRQGLFVTEVLEAARSGVGDTVRRGDTTGSVGAGLRLRLLAMFTRQLFALVSSGTPLAQSLMAIERQCDNEKWRDVVAGLRQRVEEGVSLSIAMEAYPAYFNKVCRSLIAAGESSGNMTAMLDRLSTMTRKQLHLRNTVLGALVYPCVLIVVGLGVLAIMLLAVVPRFETLFESLDVPLPPTTKLLLACSALLWSYWWVALAVVIAGVVWLRLWLRSAAGRQMIDAGVFRLPKVGKLVRNVHSARVARMIGVLVESRVQLVEALQLTRDTTGNSRIAGLISRAEIAVTNGDPMSESFADTELINASVYEAIRHGEQSGQIGSLLLHIADFLDEENEVLIKTLTGLIEPIILLALGLLVGFIALSMFIPLFDLAAMAQSGGGA